MRKNQGSKIILTFAELLLSFGGGFVFSGTSIAGIASFADISLCGAVSLPFAAAAFMGAVIRCVLTDSVGKCVVKLGAMSLIVAAKMFSRHSSLPVGCGIVTLASVVISGSAVSWLIGEFPEKLLFYGLYGIISGIAAFSASELYCRLSEKKVIELGGTHGLLLGVVYIIFIASLSAVDIPAVNIGLAVSAAVTLGAAYFYDGFRGAVCGALGAGGAFLAASDIGSAAMILPVAGLLSGFVKRGRIVISAVFFILSCFMLSVLMGEEASPELTLSIICGGAVFVAAAPNYSDKWFASAADMTANTGEMNTYRINFLSDAIDAVREDSSRISEAIAASGRRVKPKKADKKSVCGGCFKRSSCRGELAETAGELIPVLPEGCVRKKEAAAELERELRVRTARRLMELRYSDERRILEEQLRITSELVRSSAEQGSIRYSPGIAEMAEELLRRRGIAPLRVTAGYTRSNRLTVEIFFGHGREHGSPEMICGLLTDMLGVRLTAAASVSSAKELKISLFEPPKYDLEIFSASSCAEGSELSGDSCTDFSDSTGARYIVLSDGMGTGRSAAIDSHMVIGSFKRLVCSGMNVGSAVKLVNSVMVTKSREESFATLDAVVFDLDTGMLTSVKSGAAPTLIRRGNDVIKLSSPVFPIGIVEQAELSVVSQRLSPGDAVIMFSDGITENAHLFIKELLLRKDDLNGIVREIAAKAGAFDPSPRSDDVTVIGIRLTERRKDAI